MKLRLKNPITTVAGWLSGGAVILSTIDWSSVIDMDLLLLSLSTVDPKWAAISAGLTVLGITSKDGEWKKKARLM